MHQRLICLTRISDTDRALLGRNARGSAARRCPHTCTYQSALGFPEQTQRTQTPVRHPHEPLQSVTRPVTCDVLPQDRHLLPLHSSLVPIPKVAARAPLRLASISQVLLHSTVASTLCSSCGYVCGYIKPMWVQMSRGIVGTNAEIVGTSCWALTGRILDMGLAVATSTSPSEVPAPFEVSGTVP